MTAPVTMFDRHASALWAFASLLTSRAPEAERLVIQAVRAPGPRRRRVRSEGRELTASVLVSWRGYDVPGHPHVPAGPVERTDDVFVAFGRLPDAQRAAVALCSAGQRTYREAATLLGMSAAEMADLLGRAMRSAGTALAA